MGGRDSSEPGKECMAAMDASLRTVRCGLSRGCRPPASGGRLHALKGAQVSEQHTSPLNHRHVQDGNRGGVRSDRAAGEAQVVCVCLVPVPWDLVGAHAVWNSPWPSLNPPWGL